MNTTTEHHQGRAYERLEKVEGRFGRWGLIILGLVGAAITVAFFTASGHLAL